MPGEKPGGVSTVMFVAGIVPRHPDDCWTSGSESRAGRRLSMARLKPLVRRKAPRSMRKVPRSTRKAPVGSCDVGVR